MMALTELENRKTEAKRTEFFKEKVFSGYFIAKTGFSVNFSVHIMFSESNEFRPFGFIVGSSEDYNELQSFFQNNREIYEIRNSDETEISFSAEISLRSCGYRYFSRETENVEYQDIAMFDIFEFSIEEFFIKSKNEFSRTVTYFLETNRNIWPCRWRITRSFSGQRTIDLFDDEIDIELEVPVKVYSRPHYIYSEKIGTRDQRISADWEAFTLVVQDHGSNYSDAEFFYFADQVFKKLSTIIGFLSRSEIYYYRKQSETNQKISILQNDSPMAKMKDITLRELQISRANITDFITKSFKILTEINVFSLKIHTPMMLYIAAHKEGFMEDNFILMFSSLESLVDILSEEYTHMRNLEKKEIKKIRKLIEEGMKEISKDRMELVLEKIPELSRPSFKKRLEKILAERSIKIDDVGGMEGISIMYKTRNHIIHKGATPPIRAITREFYRIQTILDRIFLVLLGWDKNDNTPTYPGEISLIDTSDWEAEKA
jgi:hypothetical protein